MKQIALDRFGIDEIISLYKDKSVIKVLQGIRRQLSKTHSYNGRPSSLKRKRNYKEEYKGVDFGGVKGGASIQIHSAI